MLQCTVMHGIVTVFVESVQRLHVMMLAETESVGRRFAKQMDKLTSGAHFRCISRLDSPGGKARVLCQAGLGPQLSGDDG
jgi:hypothetical protein